MKGKFLSNHISYVNIGYSIFKLIGNELFHFHFISHFGFEGGTLVLIASVPGHCLSFTKIKIHLPKWALTFNEVLKRHRSLFAEKLKAF